MAYPTVLPTSASPLLQIETLGCAYDASAETNTFTQNDAVKSRYSYVTADTRAQVESAGYFPTPAAYVAAGGAAASAPYLRRGDVIEAVMNVGVAPQTTTPELQLYIVTQGTQSGDAANAIAPIDISDAVASLQNTVTQFIGNGGLTARLGGYVFSNTTLNQAPAATGSDIVVAFMTLPAGSFDSAGRGYDMIAKGHFAATANNKRVKIQTTATLPVVGSAIVGGTALADSGVVVTSGGGWKLEATLFKTGAAGSNTQVAYHEAAQVGAAVSALVAPQATTYVESAPIYVVVTINNTTAANDALLDGLFVEGTD